MKRKIIITIIVTLIITLLLIITKNLMYGTHTIFISDYMPTPRIGKITMIGNFFYETYSEEETSKDVKDFPALARSEAFSKLTLFIIANAVFSIVYTVIMYKRKEYTNKSDLLYSLIVFIIPLIVCYILIYNQIGFTA